MPAVFDQCVRNFRGRNKSQDHISQNDPKLKRPKSIALQVKTSPAQERENLKQQQKAVSVFILKILILRFFCQMHLHGCLDLPKRNRNTGTKPKYRNETLK